jgi:hypothetical protein
MLSRFTTSQRRWTWFPPGRLALASLAAVIAVDDHADAAKGRNERAAAFEQRVTSEPVRPLMAVV